MNATNFPQANKRHVTPEGMSEDHVKTIPSYTAVIENGPFDGSEMVVVAWQPTAEDLQRLNAGGSVFLSVMGGLPPHFMSTSFEEATTL